MPDEHINLCFIVKGSTLMTKLMKEEVLPIFEFRGGMNDYLISLQTVGQPQEILDQEKMNENTISEVGITNLHALKIIIVHKGYNKWSPSSPHRQEIPKESLKSRG